MVSAACPIDHMVSAVRPMGHVVSAVCPMSQGFCSTSYRSCVHVYVGLLCNRGVYVDPCCLSTSIYDVDTSPSPSSVCCSAVTQLVLNDTNAQHVVQVSGQ